MSQWNFRVNEGAGVKRWRTLVVGVMESGNVRLERTRIVYIYIYIYIYIYNIYIYIYIYIYIIYIYTLAYELKIKKKFINQN